MLDSDLNFSFKKWKFFFIILYFFVDDFGKLQIIVFEEKPEKHFRISSLLIILILLYWLKPFMISPPKDKAASSESEGAIFRFFSGWVYNKTLLNRPTINELSLKLWNL